MNASLWLLAATWAVTPAQSPYSCPCCAATAAKAQQPQAVSAAPENTTNFPILESFGRRMVRSFKLQPNPPFHPLDALQSRFAPTSSTQSMEPAQVIVYDQPMGSSVIAGNQAILIHDYTTMSTNPAVVPVSGEQPTAQMPLKK